MAKPTPVQPEEVPQGLVRPEKIIESLPTGQAGLPAREKISPPSAGPVSAPRASPSEELPPVPPLSWEEVAPSWGQIKAVLGMIALGLASVAITLGLWTLAVKVSSARLHPSLPPPEEIAAPELVVSAPAPQPVIHRRLPDQSVIAPQPPPAPAGQTATSAAPTVPAPASPAPPTDFSAPPVPANLKADFYSPTNTQLSWDPVEKPIATGFTPP